MNITRMSKRIKPPRITFANMERLRKQRQLALLKIQWDRSIFAKDGQLDSEAFMKEREELIEKMEEDLDRNIDQTTLFKAGKAEALFDEWEATKQLKRRQAYNRQRRESLNRLVVPLPNMPNFQAFIAQLLSRDYESLPSYMPLYSELPYGRSFTDYLKIVASDKAPDGCRSNEATGLQPHQIVVYAMATLRALGAFDVSEKDKKNKQTSGLLAMHSTGAGKTLIGLSTIVAFWNKTVPGTDDPFPIIQVSTKGNQDSNSLEKLASLAMRFFLHFKDSAGNMPFDPSTTSEGQKLLQDVPSGKKPWEDKACCEYVARKIRGRLTSGYRSIIRSDAEKGKPRPDLYTYVKLANDWKYFKTEGGKVMHALFIVDEIQFVVAPPDKEQSFHSQYKKLEKYLRDQRDQRTTWCLGMTATPGESKDEFMRIMNMISASQTFFLKMADSDFENELKGIVSYANLYGDFSHFPKLDIQSQCVRMDPDVGYGQMYMRSYDTRIRKREKQLQTISKKKNEVKELQKLLAKTRKKNDREDIEKRISKFVEDGDKPNAVWEYDPTSKRRYLAPIRDAGNYITVRQELPHEEDFQDDDDDDDGSLADNLNQTSSDVILTSDARGSYKIFVSPKLMRIVSNIKKLPGKHFVYTSSTQTMLILAHLIEKHTGLKEYIPEPGDKCTGEARQKCYRPFEGKGPSFILLDNASSTKTHAKAYAREKPVSMIEHAKIQANDPGNWDGSRIKVILATKENFKGVDMNHLRWLHLVEPMVDYQDFLQFMGRGPRYCSHSKALRKRVTLLLYRLLWTDGTCPANPTGEYAKLADCKLWQESRKRNEENWAQTTDIIQRASIDYLVFRDTLHKNMRRIEETIRDLSCTDKSIAKPKAEFPDTAKVEASKARARRLALLDATRKERRQRQKDRLGK